MYRRTEHLVARILDFPDRAVLSRSPRLTKRTWWISIAAQLCSRDSSQTSDSAVPSERSWRYETLPLDLWYLDMGDDPRTYRNILECSRAGQSPAGLWAASLDLRIQSRPCRQVGKVPFTLQRLLPLFHFHRSSTAIDDRRWQDDD